MQRMRDLDTQAFSCRYETGGLGLRGLLGNSSMWTQHRPTRGIPSCISCTLSVSQSSPLGRAMENLQHPQVLRSGALRAQLHLEFPVPWEPVSCHTAPPSSSQILGSARWGTPCARQCRAPLPSPPGLLQSHSDLSQHGLQLRSSDTPGTGSLPPKCPSSFPPTPHALEPARTQILEHSGTLFHI